MIIRIILQVCIGLWVVALCYNKLGLDNSVQEDIIFLVGWVGLWTLYDLYCYYIHNIKKGE